MKYNMKYNKKVIGSVAILIVFVVFLVIGYIISKPKEYKQSDKDIFVDSKTVESSETSGEKLITVCIKGEVKIPGVYKLKQGSIIEDLVKKAGGYTEEADKDSKVNLAKKLKDEDYIYIDKKVDLNNPQQVTKVAGNTLVSGDTKLNINNATVEDLDKISGIGPTTAQKIVEYRDKNGFYTSLEDLKKIGGIGEKTLNKFRDKLDIR